MAINKRTMPDPNEPGIQDATVSDFLLPYLMGEIPAVKGAMSMAGSAAPVMGKMAPIAEDAAGTELRDAMMQSMSRPAMAKGGVVGEDEDTMPHLADGDFSLGNDFDVNTGDSSTLKGVPLNAAAVPPVAPQADPIPKAPVAPVPAPPASPAPAVNQKPLPGMPASVTPDDIEKYLGAQKQAIEKYSPDRQFASEQNDMKWMTGLPMGLAHAGATFADGLMQGVARAGNPGFAKAIDERNASVAAARAAALERARKGTMEQVDAEQKIDMNDPNSTLSKVHQQAFASIFSRMGYDPKAVMKMPASQINTVADLGVRYADAQTQLELKKALLEVNLLTAKATMANQQAERQEKEKEIQKGAAEDTLKGSKIPFVGPSHSQKQNASQVLANMATGQTEGVSAGKTPTFASEAQAEAAHLPDGTRVTINGKTGTWRHK